MNGLPNLDLTSMSMASRELIVGAIFLVLLYMLWQLIQMLRITMGIQSTPKRVGGGLLEKDIHWAVEDEDFKLSLSEEKQGTADAKLAPFAPRREVQMRPLVSDDNLPDFMRPAAKVASMTATNTRDPLVGVGPKRTVGGGYPNRGVSKPAQPEPVRSNFAQETFMRGVEKELEEIRTELKGFRKDIGQLKQAWTMEMEELRHVQTTSPYYNDAMQLAQKGYDAATIAARCDLPPGEASLVVALAGKTQRQRA